MKKGKLAIPTSISFEQRYLDDSGTEFAVRLNNNEIEFECGDSYIANFPVEEIDWLVSCLLRIQEELLLNENQVSQDVKE